MKLPHFDRMTLTCPDVMHTVKDVVQNLLHLIIGMQDSEKVRRAEAALGRLTEPSRPEGATHPFRRQNRKRKHPDVNVPFRISDNEVKLANQRASSIVVPSESQFVPNDVFTTTSGLKSHDWKEVQIHCIGLILLPCTLVT